MKPGVYIYMQAGHGIGMSAARQRPKDAGAHDLIPPREVDLSMEDHVMRVVRLLNTPLTKLIKRGNSLTVTVRSDLVSHLNLREGSRFYMLSGMSQEQLEEAVRYARAISRGGAWILMLHKGDEEEP